jgi:hypothetical protein
VNTTPRIFFPRHMYFPALNGKLGKHSKLSGWNDINVRFSFFNVHFSFFNVCFSFFAL